MQKAQESDMGVITDNGVEYVDNVDFAEVEPEKAEEPKAAELAQDDDFFGGAENDDFYDEVK